MSNKTLILCSSPYTVLNASNYALEKADESIDIAVFVLTPRMNDIGMTLQSKSIFNRVFILKDIRNGSFFKLKAFLSILFPKISFRLLFGKGPVPSDYSKVITQNYFLASLVHRIVRNAKFFLLEEGAGTYVGSGADPSYRNKRMLFLNKYIFRGSLMPTIVGEYVYHPEFIRNTDKLIINNLPPLNETKINDLSSIFNYKLNDNYSSHRIVVLGDLYMTIRKYNDENTLINEYEMLNKFFIKGISSEAIYRPHPAETDYNGYIKTCVDNENQMWEIECYYGISNDHVLISYFSTASLIPKLLFNKEPTLLFYYPIEEQCFLPDYIKNNMNYFVELVKSMYKNKDKVILIDDKEIINSLLRKVI